MTNDQYKAFIEQWNSKYLIDFLHRKEKNITFNSPQHRAINLLDIYTEFIEKSIALDLNNGIALRLDRKQALDKGNWISNRTTIMENYQDDEDLLDMFDNLDVSKFNDSEKIQIE